MLAKVWVMLSRHYVCGIFLFFFNVTKSRGKIITNFITNCFTCTRFFSSSVLLQCAEFFFFGFVVMETSFSTTLDSNRGFGFDQHINVLETFEMKMFILRLYHNYLCKVFIWLLQFSIKLCLVFFLFLQCFQNLDIVNTNLFVYTDKIWLLQK